MLTASVIIVLAGRLVPPGSQWGTREDRVWQVHCNAPVWMAVMCHQVERLWQTGHVWQPGGRGCLGNVSWGTWKCFPSSPLLVIHVCIMIQCIVSKDLSPIKNIELSAQYSIIDMSPCGYWKIYCTKACRQRLGLVYWKSELPILFVLQIFSEATPAVPEGCPYQKEPWRLNQTPHRQHERSQEVRMLKEVWHEHIIICYPLFNIELHLSPNSSQGFRRCQRIWIDKIWFKSEGWRQYILM